jgi:hypothetical protein
MKRFLLLAAVVAFGFTGTIDAQQAQPKDVTLTASVIDLSCKVVHNLEGPDHRMCAQVCADQGIPLALLGSDGQIYLPVTMAMPGHGDNERLKPFAEQQVQVTGKVLDRGGMKSIIIEDVRRI